MERDRPSAIPHARAPSAEGRAKLLFSVAALLSFLLSVFLWFTGSKEQGLFVGLWVPSILALGALVLSPTGGGS